MKTLTTIQVLLLALWINTTAQIKIKQQPNNPKPIDYVPRNGPPNNPAPIAQNNEQQNNHHWGNGHGGGWNNGCGNGWGNVSIGFGNYPSYGNPYQYNNYYGNGYSMKKQTRYSIRAAGQIINEAVAFDTWNDNYSPMLAKAIRHYEYARQLYWYGDYQSAYNHAERARYLAWYSLQYFQNPNCNEYNGVGYDQPNPYSDPYNPYYRNDQTNNGNSNSNSGNKKEEFPKQENIDLKLPGSDINDKELIRTFDQSGVKDE